MVNTTQEYALLYCKYDSENGFRRYDLLDTPTIAQLDLAVPQKAILHESITQTTNIIYFGSPNAQKINHPEQRQHYVSTIIKCLSH